eukprot:scaffold47039_cov24-Tisochrysis_lutea.AAC.1
MQCRGWKGRSDSCPLFLSCCNAQPWPACGRLDSTPELTRTAIYTHTIEACLKHTGGAGTMPLNKVGAPRQETCELAKALYTPTCIVAPDIVCMLYRWLFARASCCWLMGMDMARLSMPFWPK